ncbi:hypothetical protein J2W20_000086 [Sinomonas atrocyanea]|uniref:nSTAND1 domain-containing NTPase n=1 Tax=Sinomonas atrocyanea TaxID=37927 RepID=UPI002783F452|nr:TIR domain-containing protein [Sinomonas atrocyanea]MDQ0258211.1 hypothetical protein [Sinomonas atrocyanea]
MARVFLSHSSRDGVAAAALKQWLVEQDPALADDIFLDSDPLTGVQIGERWKDALRRSNARCELVICLLSANWAASAECIAEYRMAESLDKMILAARLEPMSQAGITDEWQHCDLFGEGPSTIVDVDGRGHVVFLAEGLQRLLRGLQHAGIGTDHFPWPPPSDADRSPYRGWEPLEEADAAVFFGRTGEIVRGLDTLRGMRSSGIASLFVVLGPSGTGKSSYLRAGLLPRLRREGRFFLPLGIVRPGHDPLMGNRGLARSIYSLRTSVGLVRPDLASVKESCGRGDAEKLRQLLIEAAETAVTETEEVEENRPKTTFILPVDQAEELFNPDSSSRARLFLQTLARLCDGSSPDLQLIVALTIRADRYESLHNSRELAGLHSVLFSELRPLPPSQFKEVIVGPAARSTQSGRPLRVEPELVDRLIADCQYGADTLPLLAFTLKLLYEEDEASGTLSLDSYEALGGLGRVVQGGIDDILSPDSHVRHAQLMQLRSAFIPWLATINPDNDEPMRRVARYSDLPAPARPLIDAMVVKRMLVKDSRDGETVIEVALESLLRQWSDLAVWLDSERDDLKEADALERSAEAWRRHHHGEAWLLEGERLANAESLTGRAGFRERLEPVKAFVNASRQREDDRALAERRRQESELRAAREKQKEAEAHAQALRRRTRVLRTFLVATIVTALVAVLGFIQASVAEREAIARDREATALRLAAEGQAMVAGARPGGEIRGLQEMLAGEVLLPSSENERAIISTVVAKRNVSKLVTVGHPVNGVAFSPDGSRIVSGGADGTLRLWAAGSGGPVGAPMTGHHGAVNSVAFSPDGSRIVSGGADGTLRLWAAGSGAPVGAPMTGHQGAVNSVAFSPDGARIASGGDDRSIRLWTPSTRSLAAPPMNGHKNRVLSVAFSPDGRRIASGSEDYTMQLWDAGTGRALGDPTAGHGQEVRSVVFNRSGTQIGTGLEDGTLRIYDTVMLPPILGHDGAVLSTAFSPDGRQIASGGADGTVRRWDTNTARAEGAPMAGHRGAVNSVAFSPDGTRIGSGGADGTIRLGMPARGIQWGRR